MTNSYRKNHDVAELENDYRLGLIAREHSKEKALENHISDESLLSESLVKRLNNAMIDQRKAGENIALDYVDPIEAVHGWLNSPAHRKVLLDKDYTHFGTGVYGNVYTQSLIWMTGED